MTLPAFNFAQPIVDANGYASKALQVWMKAVATAVNATAGVYVPTTRRVIGSGGIKGGYTRFHSRRLSRKRRIRLRDTGVGIIRGHGARLHRRRRGARENGTLGERKQASNLNV